MTPLALFEQRSERGEYRGADEILAVARLESHPEPAGPPSPPPGRSRRRAFLAAAACAVAALGAWAIVDARDTADRVAASGTQPVPSPEPTKSADRTAAAPAGGGNPSGAGGQGVSFAHEPDELPRVVIDRPEFEIEDGGQWRTDRPDGAAPPEVPVYIYQEPDSGFDGASLTLRPQGDRFDLDGDPIQIGGLEQAEIGASSDFVTALGWNDGQEDLVLIGIRLSLEQVIAAAQSVTRDLDGTLALVSPPAGLVLAESGIPEYPDPVISAEYEYRLGDISGDLTIRSGSRIEFYDAVQGRLYGADQLVSAPIGDTQAALIGYENDRRRNALWWAEGLVFELRGDYDSLDDLAAVLADVTVVNEARWRTVTPDGWVADDELSTAVDVMLQDIPIPEGFDISRLRDIAAPGNRYQMGALLTGQIACAWIEQWFTAATAADADRAAAAMATSRDWGILQEMVDQGGYPDVVWQYADALNGNGTIIAGSELTVEETYQAALGCLR